MAITFKDLPVPLSCLHCPAAHYYPEVGRAWCKAEEKWGAGSRFFTDAHPDWCPITETPRVSYLCDRGKDCRTSPGCGIVCNHTEDIRHAVNFREYAEWYFEQEQEGMQDGG